MQAYKGSRDPALLILNLTSRWWCNFTPRPLYSREKPPSTNWTGDWVEPRAGLDALGKRKVSCPHWDSNSRPSRRHPSSYTDYATPIPILLIQTFLWLDSPYWDSASLPRLHNHTQTRHTLGRTPLHKWSARRRDLDLTTHNTRKRDRHPFPRRDSNPQSQQASGHRPTLDRAATGIGIYIDVYDVMNEDPVSLCLRVLSRPVDARKRSTVEVKDRLSWLRFLPTKRTTHRICLKETILTLILRIKT
jgi:hypothetical protein